MQTSLRPFVIILCAVILAFFLIGVLRNFVFAKQIEQFDNRYASVSKGIVFALFFIFVLALVPICLKSFLLAQLKAGNTGSAFVEMLNKHFMKVVYTAWIVFILGLCMALPFMLKDGFFKNTIN